MSSDVTSEDETMKMPIKKGAFEFNLNTIIVIVGFIFTWGVSYQTLRSDQQNIAERIGGVEKRLTLIETTSRVLDNHELRITNVEVTSRDASAALRAVETSVNSLASDMRVTREILERIERSTRQGAQR